MLIEVRPAFKLANVESPFPRHHSWLIEESRVNDQSMIALVVLFFLTISGAASFVFGFQIGLGVGLLRQRWAKRPPLDI